MDMRNFNYQFLPTCFVIDTVQVNTKEVSKSEKLMPSNCFFFIFSMPVLFNSDLVQMWTLRQTSTLRYNLTIYMSFMV